MTVGGEEGLDKHVKPSLSHQLNLNEGQPRQEFLFRFDILREIGHGSNGCGIGLQVAFLVPSPAVFGGEG